ncbi:MAG: TolC family protein [Chitinophagaceae bacterium]|nr:TolC family protein [Chitinophagaceae bacterium]
MRTILILCKRRAVLSFILMVSTVTRAQTNSLDAYIDTAFANNIVLKQKNISLQKAGYALEAAKGLFYPTVAFQAGYQTADGGRDIQLPLGDLLNGAYATLNQLTQSNKFPQLKNEQINFLPSNFYDARVRTTVPVINTDITYNKKITEQQLAISEYETEIYKRELVKNVKTAYYNYRTALEAVKIYQSALQLAEEGKRVNEKLLENGKGLPAYIVRATSEIENVKAQIIAAQQQQNNARRYFNFLLNRDQAALIDTDYVPRAEVAALQMLAVKDISTAQREELKVLKESVTLNATVLRMNKAVYYPRLNGFLDLGSQAQNWKFNAQSRYYMAGLQLDVPIFAGFRNRNKIKQSDLDVKNAELNLDQVKQQLDLAGNVAANNLLSACQTFLSSQKQLEAAQTYQRLIDRGYREGVNTYIETIDARNQLTQAQLAVSINQYKLLIAAAGVERETASFPLQKQ